MAHPVEHGLLLVSALAVALVARAGDARGQAPKVLSSPLTCGAYRVVPSNVKEIDFDPEWSVRRSQFGPNRLTIEAKGRAPVTIDTPDEAITTLECASLFPDKRAHLFLETFSGGAHCCWTTRVWAMDPSGPREVLLFEAGNSGGMDLFDAGQGQKALYLGDDTFAYYDDLCYGCSPAHLPMVVCPTNSGFRDCTRRFPESIRKQLALRKDELKQTVAENDPDFIRGRALGVYALASLLGEEVQTLEWIRATVKNDEVMAWLGRQRDYVRRWVTVRETKIKSWSK